MSLPVFLWHNTERRHAGIAFLTPEDVRNGRIEQILKTCVATLDAAFAANPSRFKGRAPTSPRPPQAVWINPPPPPALAAEQRSEQH